jgi:endogenous inhibitor of DNA gyrase (YacG/DUF329 family)
MGNRFSKMTYSEDWFTHMNKVCDEFESTDYYLNWTDGMIKSTQGFYMISKESHRAGARKGALSPHRLEQQLATLGVDGLKKRGRAIANAAKRNGTREKVNCPQCTQIISKNYLDKHVNSRKCLATQYRMSYLRERKQSAIKAAETIRSLGHYSRVACDRCGRLVCQIRMQRHLASKRCLQVEWSIYKETKI